ADGRGRAGTGRAGTPSSRGVNPRPHRRAAVDPLRGLRDAPALGRGPGLSGGQGLRGRDRWAGLSGLRPARRPRPPPHLRRAPETAWADGPAPRPRPNGEPDPGRSGGWVGDRRSGGRAGAVRPALHRPPDLRHARPRGRDVLGRVGARQPAGGGRAGRPAPGARGAWPLPAAALAARLCGGAHPRDGWGGHHRALRAGLGAARGAPRVRGPPDRRRV
ncbi:MAG: hypothetical protein AVDCRST_MAG73-3301, partial [uncultured Thermomicrobiales bacterium]